MKVIFSFSNSTWLLVFASAICLFSPSLSLSQSGKIVGTVSYKGKQSTPRIAEIRDIPECAAKNPKGTSNILVLGAGNTLGNVLIRVKNPPKQIAVPVPSKAVVITQNGCLFSPRLAVVQIGQPLRFKNSDGILHNVRGFPKVNKNFNIGMPPSAASKTIQFNQAEEPFNIKSDVHPWMNAYVGVMTHPYYAVTNKQGSFSISGLPPGTYQLEAWHEKLGTQTLEVTVGKQSTSANFSFK